MERFEELPVIDDPMLIIVVGILGLVVNVIGLVLFSSHASLQGMVFLLADKKFNVFDLSLAAHGHSHSHESQGHSHGHGDDKDLIESGNTEGLSVAFLLAAFSDPNE